jgi:hypothetical protein
MAGTVSEVIISPASQTLERGATQQFSATIQGAGNPPQTVIWSVTGGNSGTSISTDGLLTVSYIETAATLTVMATSTAAVSTGIFNPTRGLFGTANIEIENALPCQA